MNIYEICPAIVFSFGMITVLVLLAINKFVNSMITIKCPSFLNMALKDAILQAKKQRIQLICVCVGSPDEQVFPTDQARKNSSFRIKQQIPSPGERIFHQRSVVRIVCEWEGDQTESEDSEK